LVGVGSETILIPCNIILPNEAIGKKMETYILNCHLANAEPKLDLEKMVIPDVVELLNNGTRVEINSTIVVQKQIVKEKRRITTCLPTLFGTKGVPENFIEWIEYYRLLGTEYFIVYHEESSPNFKQILNYYANELRIMTIVDWSKCANYDIWYHDQLGMINDCMYRNYMSSDWMAVNDYDEFILLKKYNYWDDLLKDIEVKGQNTTSIILFKHNRVSPYCTDPKEKLLITQMRHTQHTWVLGRSKYWAKPELSINLNIHIPREVIGTIVTIPSNKAVLRHMYIPKNRSELCTPTTQAFWSKQLDFESYREISSEMLRYKETLLPRVINIYETVYNTTFY